MNDPMNSSGNYRSYGLFVILENESGAEYTKKEEGEREIEKMIDTYLGYAESRR